VIHFDLCTGNLRLRKVFDAHKIFLDNYSSKLTANFRYCNYETFFLRYKILPLQEDHMLRVRYKRDRNDHTIRVKYKIQKIHGKPECFIQSIEPERQGLYFSDFQNIYVINHHNITK
jgi:hypothetical protein